MNASAAADAASDDAAAVSATDDPEQIREQIEQTRAGMSETIDEIQERLSPQNIIQQAKDSVHDATVGRVKQMMGSAGETASDVVGRAQETAGTVVDRVRENPWPAVLVGAGIGWLLLRGTSEPRTYRTREVGRRGTGRYNSFRGRGVYGSAGRDYGDDEGYDVYEDETSRAREDYDDYASRSGASGWMQRITSNPIPATLVAAGVAYLMMNRQGPDRGWSASGSGYREARDARASYGSSRRSVARSAADMSRSATASVRNVSQQARDKVSDLTDQARDKVSGLTESAKQSVSSLTDQAREKASDLTGNVQEGWDTVRTTTRTEFERWMDENPLAVGAAALALGAAVGLAAPGTEAEDQMMGTARDSLVDMAQGAAQQATEKVQEVAKQATEKVQEVAKQAMSSDQPGGGQSSGGGQNAGGQSGGDTHL